MGIRRCPKCELHLDLNLFYKSSTSYCKSCCKKYQRRVSKQNSPDPRVRMWRSSKNRMPKSHAISPEDITLVDCCPYLGVKLDYSHPASRKGKRTCYQATLDRIDSSKGYVPGNVQVISWLANKMKSNATIEELVSFATNTLKIHSTEILLS